jgi:hypothetical protein
MSAQTMNIIAVVLGPISAVIITLFYQTHRQKQDIKHRAFLTLMAHRKAIQPNPGLVEVLNTMDVIFPKNRNILNLWHEYFASLCQPNPTPIMLDLQRQKLLDLLWEIASELGYKHLRQTDIDKFYTPQGHVDQLKKSSEIQDSFLRVLKNTESLVLTKREAGEVRIPDLKS